MVNPSSPPTANILKEIKLFQSFTESELSHLAQSGAAQNYEAHTNVVVEGELSWGLYIILKGMVGITKTNKLTGNNYDVGQLREGSFFGEMSLVDENPRSATVRTLINCELFYISKEIFNRFMDQSNDLKLRFYSNCIKILVTRLRELDDNYVISQYQLWEKALKKDEGIR